MARVTLRPNSAAVQTRGSKSQNDYRWHERGRAKGSRLYKNALSCASKLLCDRASTSGMTCAFMRDGVDVGLIVTNLKTNRSDGQRWIYDDLYIACDAGQESDMLKLFGVLLQADGGEAVLSQALTKHAEALYGTSEQAPLEPLEIELPDAKEGVDVLAIEPRKCAMPNTRENQRAIAGMLGSLQGPCLIVATGMARIEDIRAIAQSYDTVQVCSESSTVKEKINLEEDKTTGPFGRAKQTVAVAACVVFFVMALIILRHFVPTRRPTVTSARAAAGVTGPNSWDVELTFSKPMKTNTVPVVTFQDGSRHTSTHGSMWISERICRVSVTSHGGDVPRRVVLRVNEAVSGDKRPMKAQALAVEMK
jgi:hypothetical protein